MSNPYKSLPDNAFWKLSVSDRHFYDISGLWDPKFSINKKHKISTFGSCFAQHIGKHLRENGFNWFVPESRPKGLSVEEVKSYNYETFSCRTGNIYTTSLLNQWVDFALDDDRFNEFSDYFWYENGRVFDPFRPNIEPLGFVDLEEALNSRKQTVDSFKRCLLESDFFVFTLGLVESWFDEGGFEYPVCPGTAAGSFNGSKHLFVKQDFEFISSQLILAIGKIRSVNPKIKFILTVSPVPLVATYTKEHVLVATLEAKSILRAVASEVTAKLGDCVDYFPSYEVINSPVFKGSFFEPNLRSVHRHGVSFVMDSFFSPLVNKYRVKGQKTLLTESYDIVCEEELIDSFKK